MPIIETTNRSVRDRCATINNRNTSNIISFRLAYHAISEEKEKQQHTDERILAGAPSQSPAPFRLRRIYKRTD